jgi:hypothetical protein
VQKVLARQLAGILGVVPPEATVGTVLVATAGAVLAGAALVASAIPVEKPPMTMAATMINMAVRTNCLMCIVPPE